MVTLGVALVLREIANRSHWLTGGADGLQGVEIAPLLGLFRFDIFGHTAYVYCARRAVRAVPAGAPHRQLAVRAVAAVDQGQSAARVRRSASRSTARLVAIYTIAAGYAGIAGALLTQTTAFASLDVFSFERSADVLLVLIIGGTGYLYGGLDRRRPLQADAGLARRPHAAILAVLDRPAAGRDRAGRPRAHRAAGRLPFRALARRARLARTRRLPPASAGGRR